MSAAAQADPISVDAAIVGGGIAGLWLANLLRRRGYSIVLLEADSLGGGQTLASQGMIHGGLKYALAGRLTGASEAIADMPARWRACLEGQGEFDLSAVIPQSSQYYMFAGGSPRGRLTTFFASRSLRGRIHRLAPAEFPAVLAHPGFSGVVYTLQDFVVDTPALIDALHAPIADAAYQWRLTADTIELEPGGEPGPGGVVLSLGALRLRAERLLLAAGAGTQALLDGLGLESPRMQKRPLHQVLVRHPQLEPFFAHCLTGIRRAEPRLTITSHRDPAGGWLWYLGGQIAGDGVDLMPAAQIDHARKELNTCLPWIDWRRADISTLRIDRAEPVQAQGLRPDQAFAERRGAIVVAWPTKLSLAPDLGDRVLTLLPPPGHGTPPPSLNLPAARPGTPPWQRGA